MRDQDLDLELAKLCQRSYYEHTFRHQNSAVLVSQTDTYIAVAFKGTSTLNGWMGNLRAIPAKPEDLGVRVHRGFWMYTKPLIEELVGLIIQTDLPLHITGHSLGGAAACIFAGVCKHRRIYVTGLTTFAAPKPGLEGLADLTWDIPGERYVLDGDPVPHLPRGWIFDYVHDRIPYVFPEVDGADHPIDNYIEALMSAAR